MRAAALETEVDAYLAGLASSVATRATVAWQAEHRAFMGESLRTVRPLRPGGRRALARPPRDELRSASSSACASTGEEADGHGASAESWAALLRDLHHRGMRAPVGALGDVRPGPRGVAGRPPRDRGAALLVHEVAKVLDTVAKSIQPLRG